MVTTAGTQTNERDLVEALLSLEHDAIEAYESCIERLDDRALADQVDGFLGDHRRHLQELTTHASRLGITDDGGSMKSMLTTGKIALADLMGDEAILKAMATNEEDTVTAYERAAGQQSVSPELAGVFRNAHADELRHREWMRTTAERMNAHA